MAPVRLSAPMFRRHRAIVVSRRSRDDLATGTGYVRRVSLLHKQRPFVATTRQGPPGSESGGALTQTFVLCESLHFRMTVFIECAHRDAELLRAHEPQGWLLALSRTVSHRRGGAESPAHRAPAVPDLSMRAPQETSTDRSCSPRSLPCPCAPLGVATTEVRAQSGGLTPTSQAHFAEPPRPCVLRSMAHVPARPARHTPARMHTDQAG